MRFKTVAAAAALWALSGGMLSLAQSDGFRYRGLLSRVLTPNNDGINDVAIFCVDNPDDVAVEGKIYTLFGSEVATLGPAVSAASTACPQDSVVSSGPRYLAWEGRSNGSGVRSGVYIYRIRAESRVFTGSLLVVR